jgi:arsenate reductase-like glutaredoxin family protein
MFKGKADQQACLILLNYMETYISADERAEKVMENQSVIRQPIVRNGRQATVGYVPEVWKTWQ